MEYSHSEGQLGLCLEHLSQVHPALVPRESEREWALGPGEGLGFLGAPQGYGWPS